MNILARVITMYKDVVHSTVEVVWWYISLDLYCQVWPGSFFFKVYELNTRVSWPTSFKLCSNFAILRFCNLNLWNSAIYLTVRLGLSVVCYFSSLFSSLFCSVIVMFSGETVGLTCKTCCGSSTPWCGGSAAEGGAGMARETSCRLGGCLLMLTACWACN